MGTDLGDLGAGAKVSSEFSTEGFVGHKRKVDVVF